MDTTKLEYETVAECALKEGIDPDCDLRKVEGASWCPHGTPYSFRNIFTAGFRRGRMDIMALIEKVSKKVDILESQMDYTLAHDKDISIWVKELQQQVRDLQLAQVRMSLRLDEKASTFGKFCKVCFDLANDDGYCPKHKPSPQRVVETIRKEELDLKEQLKKEDAQKRYAELLAQQQAFSSLKEQVTKAPSFVTRGNVIDKPISYEEPPPAPKFWMKWIYNSEKNCTCPNIWNIAGDAGNTFLVYCHTRENFIKAIENAMFWIQFRSDLTSADVKKLVTTWADDYLKSNGGV